MPSTSDGSFLLLVGYIIISAIAITISAFIPKREHQDSSRLTYQYHPKVPCAHCRYFSLNAYLQCSVHPTTVMTKEAIECQDYSPDRQE